LKATNACRVLHLAYNTELAPSDFFLFVGFLKEKLQGIALTDEDDFISRLPSHFRSNTRFNLAIGLHDLDQAISFAHQKCT
jgi:hypothetical protein